MESEWFRGGSSFDGFAFNDNHLSNRTDPLDAPPDSVWARLCKKRRHENDNIGDEAAKRYRDSSAVRVQTLHITSHILPFFYKLSSYGMSESEQTHVRIKLSGNSLNITTAPELLDVLMAADKFEVSSCMNYCRQLLRNSPMTLNSALLYLEFPHTDALQPLTHAAKQYLVGRYKIITKFKEEVMALPLSGIEALLASDDLRVVCEDVVYYTVLKWVRQHYDEQKERQEVVGTRLARLIRFPYMTCRTLEKVLTCDDFAHKDAFELVLEAILFKADAQQSLTTYALNPRFVERAYLDRYVKVVEFEPPRQQCVVYLDLKQKECVTWFPFGGIKTQPFYLGRQRFFLAAKCNTIDECKFHFFDMIVAMSEKSSGSFVVDLEYAARLRPGEEFVNMFKSHYTFTAGTSVGGDMFGVPWTKFIAEDSPFFINGILHLRAQLTIIP